MNMSRPPCLFFRCLPEDAGHLRALRTCEGVILISSPECLWVRVPGTAESILKLLSAMPVEGPLESTADGTMLRFSGEVTGLWPMPDGQHTTIHEFFPVVPPAISRHQISIEPDQRLLPQLVQSTESRKPEALLCGWLALENWALRSAGTNEKGLLYAASTHGHAVVFGNSLPALPGKLLWCAGDNIYIQAGWDLARSIDRHILSRMILDPAADEAQPHAGSDILILLHKRQPDRIPAGCVTPLNRSSIRLTSWSHYS